MRIQRLLTTLAVASAAALVLAACGGGGGSAATTSAFPGPVGPGEGQVNVLAWPGYVENGSTDPAVDWVTQWEKDTNCKVNLKTFGTSDEAVKLMQGGGWDVVSASGDATLRLVAGGNVQPVNTSLVPNYVDVFADLKDKSWNTVDGVNYGVPHGRGANLLMYRTDLVKPAPTSWDVTFYTPSPYTGKVTGYDSPIFIADAAVYLMATKPELGIKDPYALDKTQFDAAIELLKQQKTIVGEYWSDYLKAIQSFKSGTTALGTSWQVIVNLAQAEGVPVDAIKPKEGATGWSDTWMIAAKAAHPNCMYRWMSYIVSPKVNAAVAEYFGEAPAQTKACELTTDKQFCTTFHATDAAYADQISYWTTPQTKCVDGSGDNCTAYSEWVDKWQQIKG